MSGEGGRGPIHGRDCALPPDWRADHPACTCGVAARVNALGKTLHAIGAVRPAPWPAQPSESEREGARCRWCADGWPLRTSRYREPWHSYPPSYKGQRVGVGVNCEAPPSPPNAGQSREPAAPPPGPGQDVEAQARAQNEQAWRETRAWMDAPCPHPDTLGASQNECWHCVAALRAVADAEMCDGCGRVPPVPDDGKCGCHGEGRSGMLRHARIVLQKTQDALEAAERRAQEAEAREDGEVKARLDAEIQRDEAQAELAARERAAEQRGRAEALREAAADIDELGLDNLAPEVAAWLERRAASPVSSQSEPKE
jgi:hypothetical protein